MELSLVYFIRNRRLLVPEARLYVIPLYSLDVGICGHGDALWNNVLRFG